MKNRKSKEKNKEDKDTELNLIERFGVILKSMVNYQASNCTNVVKNIMDNTQSKILPAQLTVVNENADLTKKRKNNVRNLFRLCNWTFPDNLAEACYTINGSLPRFKKSLVSRKELESFAVLVFDYKGYRVAINNAYIEKGRFTGEIQNGVLCRSKTKNKNDNDKDDYGDSYNNVLLGIDAYDSIALEDFNESNSDCKIFLKTEHLMKTITNPNLNKNSDRRKRSEYVTRGSGSKRSKDFVPDNCVKLDFFFSKKNKENKENKGNKEKVTKIIDVDNAKEINVHNLGNELEMKKQVDELFKDHPNMYKLDLVLCDIQLETITKIPCFIKVDEDNNDINIYLHYHRQLNGKDYFIKFNKTKMENVILYITTNKNQNQNQNKTKHNS